MFMDKNIKMSENMVESPLTPKAVLPRPKHLKEVFPLGRGYFSTGRLKRHDGQQKHERLNAQTVSQGFFLFKKNGSDAHLPQNPVR